MALIILKAWLITFVKARHSEVTYRAINEVISALFIRRGLSFEILIFGEKSSAISDTLDKFLERLEDNKPIKVRRLNKNTIVEKYQNWPYTNYQYSDGILEGLKEPALILGDWKNLKSIDLGKIGLTNLFPKTLNFLFFMNEGDIDLESFAVNPGSFYGHLSQKSYFLINNGSNIYLKTFEWWTEDACNQTQLVTLNTFTKKSQKWSQQPLEIPEKFTNFHNCILKSCSSIFSNNIADMLRDLNMIDFDPLVSVSLDKKEILETQLVETFAKKGNFSIYRPNINDDCFSIEHITGRTAGNFTFVQKMFAFRFLDVDCTATFDEQKVFAMYSPPEPYTNYEKMLLPFDDTTWIYLAITFAIAFVFIFFTNLLPSVFKNIVFGQGVKMPTFNVIGTFFGISQPRLPENNFGRIILMFFIIFCLIFRTAYQGK